MKETRTTGDDRQGFFWGYSSTSRLVFPLIYIGRAGFTFPGMTEFGFQLTTDRETEEEGEAAGRAFQMSGPKCKEKEKGERLGV